MTPPADVPNLLRALPAGTVTGTAFDQPYVATRTIFNGGKSEKLVAEQRGGADYISLNLYHLAAGSQLYPCEMPAAKAIAFLRAFQPNVGHG